MHISSNLANIAVMKYFTHIPVILAALLCLACNGQKTAEPAETPVKESLTQLNSFQESNEFVTVNLSLELPNGTDDASQLMRDSLTAEFIRIATQVGYQEEDAGAIAPFTGDPADASAVVTYYGKAVSNYLLNLAKADHEQRIGYLKEDTSIPDSTREQLMEEITPWNFDFNLRKSLETVTYVIYSGEGYVYYGGAHGGVTGAGAMTFNKSNGQQVMHFVNPDATLALQPQIRKGLLRYYGEYGEPLTDQELSERLMLPEPDDSIIPQPKQIPFPNAAGDSLTFTYGQYEIACYADGMPSFKIAVKDLAPYLTDEAKAILP